MAEQGNLVFPVSAKRLRPKRSRKRGFKVHRNLLAEIEAAEATDGQSTPGGLQLQDDILQYLQKVSKNVHRLTMGQKAMTDRLEHVAISAEQALDKQYEATKEALRSHHNRLKSLEGHVATVQSLDARLAKVEHHVSGGALLDLVRDSVQQTFDERLRGIKSTLSVAHDTAKRAESTHQIEGNALKEALTALGTRLTCAENHNRGSVKTVDNMLDRLAIVEGRTNLEARIVAIEERALQQRSELANVESRVDGFEACALQSESGQTARVAHLVVDVQQLQQELEQLQSTTIEHLSTKLNEDGASLRELDDRLRQDANGISRELGEQLAALRSEGAKQRALLASTALRTKHTVEHVPNTATGNPALPANAPTAAAHVPRTSTPAATTSQPSTAPGLTLDQQTDAARTAALLEAMGVGLTHTQGKQPAVARTTATKPPQVTFGQPTAHPTGDSAGPSNAPRQAPHGAIPVAAPSRGALCPPIGPNGAPGHAQPSPAQPPIAALPRPEMYPPPPPPPGLRQTQPPATQQRSQEMEMLQQIVTLLRDQQQSGRQQKGGKKGGVAPRGGNGPNWSHRARGAPHYHQQGIGQRSVYGNPAASYGASPWVHQQQSLEQPHMAWPNQLQHAAAWQPGRSLKGKEPYMEAQQLPQPPHPDHLHPQQTGHHYPSPTDNDNWVRGQNSGNYWQSGATNYGYGHHYPYPNEARRW